MRRKPEEDPKMTIEKLREIKQSLGLTNHDISEISGVPFSTVQKVFSGTTRSPRKETILTLERSLRLPELLDDPYIKKLVAQPDGSGSADGDEPGTSGLPFDSSDMMRDGGAGTASRVGEVSPEYHTAAGAKRGKLDPDHLDRQGAYTANDLRRLPDNVRAELTDGFITIMETPSTIHQKLVLYIADQMLPCVEKHEECELLIAPVDVMLDRDDRTVVQPDLLVICDRGKDKVKNIYGAPDFIVEVCSPSTRKRDMIDKLGKYEHAEVREYWIVDPELESIIRYDFTDGLKMSQFTFNDKVTVSISGGECEVDFREVKAHL